jgi:hypothetical protein
VAEKRATIHSDSRRRRNCESSIMLCVTKSYHSSRQQGPKSIQKNFSGLSEGN